MGQIQSDLPELSYNHNDNNALPQRDSQRYTLVNIPITNRVVTIHDHRYQFDKKLGEGGFAEVYAGRRMHDGKPVAIKITSFATKDDSHIDLIARSILREIAMCKRLAKTSVHIVHMYDFDFHRDTGLAFIVMELGKENLLDAIHKMKPLPSGLRKQAWRQIVDIAMTLYDRQIVHMDIKPNNLVLFPGNIIKLIDLGIAEKAHHRRREEGIGTPGFSAPEVVGATPTMKINSRKADVWSWGAVLYYMTYYTSPDPYYNPPCYHPPAGQHSTRDRDLLSILRHTLVINQDERPSAPWLASHRYTTKH